MNSDSILSALNSAAAFAGEYLKMFSSWIWELLQKLFSSIALSVSTWLSGITLPMMPTILKIFSNRKLNSAVFFIIVAYIVIINICAIIMYGSAKKKAQTRKDRRISEKSLLKVCILGGALGGLLGMQIFRHKTQHKKFTVTVPLLFVLQLILYSFILGFLGFWAFF